MVIKQTKHIVRIIDATTEPYQEWHIDTVKPLLNPKKATVVAVPEEEWNQIKRKV